MRYGDGWQIRLYGGFHHGGRMDLYHESSYEFHDRIARSMGYKLLQKIGKIYVYGK